MKQVYNWPNYRTRCTRLRYNVAKLHKKFAIYELHITENACIVKYESIRVCARASHSREFSNNSDYRNDE